MLFEQLPNEILYYIFSHLTPYHLFLTFNNLNTQMNNIIHRHHLHVQLEKYVDNDVLKYYFDKIISTVPHSICSLTLSTDDQLQQFNKRFNIEYFTKLQYISLKCDKMCEFTQIVSKLRHVTNLKIEFRRDRVSNDIRNQNMQQLFHLVWSLPVLKSCSLLDGYFSSGDKDMIHVPSNMEILSINKTPPPTPSQLEYFSFLSDNVHENNDWLIDAQQWKLIFEQMTQLKHIELDIQLARGYKSIDHFKTLLTSFQTEYYRQKNWNIIFDYFIHPSDSKLAHVYTIPHSNIELRTNLYNVLTVATFPTNLTCEKINYLIIDIQLPTYSAKQQQRRFPSVKKLCLCADEFDDELNDEFDATTFVSDLQQFITLENVQELEHEFKQWVLLEQILICSPNIHRLSLSVCLNDLEEIYCNETLSTLLRSAINELEFYRHMFSPDISPWSSDYVEHFIGIFSNVTKFSGSLYNMNDFYRLLPIILVQMKKIRHISFHLRDSVTYDRERMSDLLNLLKPVKQFKFDVYYLHIWLEETDIHLR
ncbi:unnamed protein product [Didymodactylos carnosus]|uniref:F-box domain-containing protein n=1 Tax=Didymodactylos carnosus TaxID=1234261 RepID=A0A815Z053_9BILA|nr:unnamed protein product [Didymodactylos carnosus]CAF4444064.1 unnamed protein product [Didymodactylos carnosus]